MEKRLTRKIETYQLDFKKSIKDWFHSNNCSIYDENKNDKTSVFLQYIFDYNNIQLEKEDFQKRKRIKNAIPIFERCLAKRANGEQCSRRKMSDNEYCGTHMKGTPHGILSQSNDNSIQEKKYTIETQAEEINGIIYYLDKNFNVYHPHDILTYKQNPRCIAKWKKDENDNYIIINEN